MNSLLHHRAYWSVPRHVVMNETWKNCFSCLCCPGCVHLEVWSMITVNSVPPVRLQPPQKVKVNCSGTVVASGVLLYRRDSSSRRETFCLPDISLAVSHCLTWLRVYTYQAVQQNGKKRKATTLRQALRSCLRSRPIMHSQTILLHLFV